MDISKKEVLHQETYKGYSLIIYVQWHSYCYKIANQVNGRWRVKRETKISGRGFHGVLEHARNHIDNHLIPKDAKLCEADNG